MSGLNSLSFQGPDPISFPGFCASSGERLRATCFGYIFMYSEARFSRNKGLANLIGTLMVLSSITWGALVFIERSQHPGPDSDGSGLGDPVQGEFDVLRDDGLPVVPLRRPQMEGVGFPVPTHRPALAQVADDFVGVHRIVVHEPVELRGSGHEAVRKSAASVNIPLARVEAGDAAKDHLLVPSPGDPVRRPGKDEGLSIRRWRLRGRWRGDPADDHEEQQGNGKHDCVSVIVAVTLSHFSSTPPATD